MPTILKETYPTAKKEHIVSFVAIRYSRDKNMFARQMYMTESCMTLSHIKNVRKLPMN